MIVHIKPDAKITMRLFILLIVIALIMCVFSLTSCSSKNKKEAESQLEKIEKYIRDNQQWIALIEIRKFYAKEYADDFQTIRQRIDNIYNDIEDSAYNDIFGRAVYDIPLTRNYYAGGKCDSYINGFPNGRYMEEVELLRVDYYEKFIDDLRDAMVLAVETGSIKGLEKADEAYYDCIPYLRQQKILDEHSFELLKEVIESDEYKALKEQLTERKPISVDIKTLLSNASKYSLKYVAISEPLIIIEVDRERKTLIVCLENDSSFRIEVRYDNANITKDWGMVSSNDQIKVKVSGIFTIYADRNNTGYIEAVSIDEQR